MEEVSFVELPNGETIAYRHREGNEPVLLLHGNQSSSMHWDHVFEEMNDRYELYAMDLRGFGESSYEEQIDEIADFAEDVRLFADAVDLNASHVWG